MRFLYCALLGILLCLFSCKSSKDISSMILKSHQQGSIDSVIVSDYLDWNHDKHEGVGLQKYVKTQYNRQGNTTQIEEVCRTKSDSFVLLKKTNFKYDKKNRLVEKEIINFDITGHIKNTLSEKLIKRKKNVETWTVDYGVEIRTFDNDTETIRFLLDSESVDTGLTYCKKYSTDGQMLNKKITSSHIAIIDSCIYNPISRFLIKETGDSSVSFSEYTLSYTYYYTYMDSDNLGNWTLRVRSNKDKANPETIYQTQKIYYKK